MSERLPLACTLINRIVQPEKPVFFQNIINGLLAMIAVYPTPPVLPADLQTLLDAYTLALSDAALRGKQNTSAKDAAYVAVFNAIRVDQAYVNQINFNLIAAGTNYVTIRTNILGTGYFLSTDPSPVGPLPTPENFRTRSLQKGNLQVQVNAERQATGLEVWYKPHTAPDTAWIIDTSTTQRPIYTGLTSGVTMDVKCAFIGSNPTRNFTEILQQVVV